MFYLTEFYYRTFYFFFSTIISSFLLYIYKNDIIFITIIPSFLEENTINYFIFTEPKEIFFFYLYSCFNFLLFILIPYLIINIFDYLKSALYYSEWNKLKNIKNKILITYFLINLFTLFLGLPIFWKFFSSFQNISDLFPFFLELSALNYYYYFNSIFLLTNLLQFLLFLGIIFFFQAGISYILKYKVYIIISFLLFSTLITPPELNIQVLLFCSLYICLEIFLFFYFFFIFFKKYLLLDKIFKKVTN